MDVGGKAGSLRLLQSIESAIGHAGIGPAAHACVEKELAKLQVERGNFERATATSLRVRREVRVRREAPRDLAGAGTSSLLSSLLNRKASMPPYVKYCCAQPYYCWDAPLLNSCKSFNKLSTRFQISAYPPKEGFLCGSRITDSYPNEYYGSQKQPRAEEPKNYFIRPETS